MDGFHPAGSNDFSDEEEKKKVSMYVVLLFFFISSSPLLSLFSLLLFFFSSSLDSSRLLGVFCFVMSCQRIVVLRSCSQEENVTRGEANLPLRSSLRSHRITRLHAARADAMSCIESRMANNSYWAPANAIPTWRAPL